VRQLSDKLALDPGTISPLLKRLDVAGLIDRRRGADDERTLEVRLTARGRALRRKAERIPPAIVAKLGMSLDDLEDLRVRLTELIEAASAASG
jgi:DNA-binding MarR family transcriptional regulator